MTGSRDTFELRAVVHLVRPWGTAAKNLDELRDGIASAPPDVLFYHTAQYPLRNPGAGELPPDDIASWVGGVVQDPETAERLSFAVQSGGGSAASARSALLGVLDTLPQKTRVSRDAPEQGGFVFLAAASVSVPTGIVVHDGHQLMEALVGGDPSVWFYHLVEEPWFGEARAPLLEWLTERGNPRLADWLAHASAAGLPIGRACGHALKRWRRSTLARRITEAAGAPDDVRRESGRQVVARLVRRVTLPDGSS